MKSGTTLFEEEEPYHSIKEQVLEKLDWNRKKGKVGKSEYQHTVNTAKLATKTMKEEDDRAWRNRGVDPWPEPFHLNIVTSAQTP